MAVRVNSGILHFKGFTRNHARASDTGWRIVLGLVRLKQRLRMRRQRTLQRSG